MSMPIQRQSEQFGYFDDGPRFARDRTSTDLPRGLAALINTSGPRIQGGMLNTRTAVNTDGMHPEDHAYHTELPPGRGGEVTWVDDAENYGRNPRREYNPDFGYEPTDEDERRQEGVAEDDDSGYNWGPEPRRASRHPFDRTAGAWQDLIDKDSPGPFGGDNPEDFFTNWLERGPRPGENDDPPRKRKAGLFRAAACETCGVDVYHMSGTGWVHADDDDNEGWVHDEDHQAEPDHDDDLGLGLSSMNAEHERRELQGRRTAKSHHHHHEAGWAEDNPSYDETMKHIDDTLAEGERGGGASFGTVGPNTTSGPHMLSVERRLVDGLEEDYDYDDDNHNLNPEMVHEHHESPESAIDRLHNLAGDWGCELNEQYENRPHGARMFRFDGPEEEEVQGYAELRPHTKSGRKTASDENRRKYFSEYSDEHMINWDKRLGDDDPMWPHVSAEIADRARISPTVNEYHRDTSGAMWDSDKNDWSHWDYDSQTKNWTPKESSRRRRTAAEAASQDPAMAPQMPVGGGFLPGHRVGLDWRDRTIPGTVIANDGQVHIRWDEGQYTSEDPTEVRLL